MPGCWPRAPASSPTTWLPRPNRSCSSRQAGPAPAAPAHGLSGGGRRPRRGRRDPPTAPRAAGLWLTATLDNMVAVDGLLEAEAGQTVLAALEPLARPADADDPAVVASGPLMPWPSWAAGPWPGAAAPGWWGPTQLLVTVDSTAWPATPAASAA